MALLLRSLRDNLGLVVLLELRYGLVVGFLHVIDMLFRDFEITLVGLGNLLELIYNGGANFRHLIPQINDGKMVLAVSRGPVSFLAGQIEVLAAQLGHYVIFQSICDGGVDGACGIGSKNRLDPIELRARSAN